MLTLKEAARLFKDECAILLAKVMADDAPKLEYGLCSLLSKRLDYERVEEFDSDNCGVIGYVIMRRTVTAHEFVGYLGGTLGVWNAERIAYLEGVVAMTYEEWEVRVLRGKPFNA